MKRIICLFIAILGAQIMRADSFGRLTLHYNKPATYFEEALVLGNGTMGAIVYGGSDADRVSLNDLTLWTGEPEKFVEDDTYKTIPEIRAALDREDYREADRLQRRVQGHYSENYQPLGTLTISYAGGEVKDYARWLDISKAVAGTRYSKDGGEVTTDYFVSAPDSVIVIRLRSEKPINARLSFDSPLPHTYSAQDDGLIVDGYAAYKSYPGYYNEAKEKLLYDPARGIHFRTMVRVFPLDGKVTDGVNLENVHEAMILIANATSFNGFDKNPVSAGSDYRGIVAGRMERAAAKSFEELRRAHIEDYKTYFDRVQLDLGKTDDAISSLPTDEQLKLYTSQNQRNPELEALYFQYGRYLLISCSRTSGVPANLQGLWNEYILPPWSSNYTTNINLSENYWAAETANLSEMHRPLLEFLRNASVSGKKVAKTFYGVQNGWCLGHNSDIWAMACPVGMKVGDPMWANWNMGGAWLSTHIWEHYMFTQDKDFLGEYYPVLKGAAEFCMDWLIEKNGKLMTSPSTSPENLFMTPDGYVGATLYGGTADLAMSRECLQDALQAAKVLKLDRGFQKRIQDVLKRMQPYQIGHKGNLQEWYYDWEDNDPWHRHQSHLFGLYPGHHLSVAETPELARACSKTLEIKGDNTTGWSTGWRVNLYARLRDGGKAYHFYRTLLRYISPDNYQGEDASRGGGTYPNLLDAHSPFQIDGNFGGCAGVLEMLVQSTADSITLLPALPEEWKTGSVKGICARGGFVLDISWKDGKVCSLDVTSRNGGKTTINYNGVRKHVKLKKGERIQCHFFR